MRDQHCQQKSSSSKDEIQLCGKIGRFRWLSEKILEIITFQVGNRRCIHVLMFPDNVKNKSYSQEDNMLSGVYTIFPTGNV